MEGIYNGFMEGLQAADLREATRSSQNDLATRFEDSRSTSTASTVVNQDIEVAGNVSQDLNQSVANRTVAGRKRFRKLLRSPLSCNFKYLIVCPYICSRISLAEKLFELFDSHS